MFVLGVSLFLDRGRTAGGLGRPAQLAGVFISGKEGRVQVGIRCPCRARPATGPRSGREAASKLHGDAIICRYPASFRKTPLVFGHFLEGVKNPIFINRFLAISGPIWAHNPPNRGHGWLSLVFLCISGTTNVQFGAKNPIFRAFSLNF